MGGAERVVSELTSRLKHKFDIEILTLKSGKFYDPGVKQTSLLNNNSNLLMFFAFPYYVWKLRKILKQNPDCRIVGFSEWSNFIEIFTGTAAIIVFNTTISFFKGFKGAIYKLLIYLLYPKTRLIIVNSIENKLDVASRLNIDPAKIQVIYNPQDFDRIKKLKSESVEDDFLRLIKNRRLFISVGRFDEVKRFDILISAFRKLVDRDSKNVLVILGDGTLRAELELLIKNLDLTANVFLIGRKTNVFKYLNKADYFVYSSRVEGFPNALLEAMSVGLPIITSDFKTGARELIAPNLEFNKEIKYPYYGPNGVLISLLNFEQDLLNVTLAKVKQERKGMEKFDIKNVIKDWTKLLI